MSRIIYIIEPLDGSEPLAAFEDESQAINYAVARGALVSETVLCDYHAGVAMLAEREYEHGVDVERDHATCNEYDQA